MNRLFISALAFGLVIALPAYGQVPTDSVKRVVVRDDQEIKYREGMQLEQLRLYPQARAIYVDIAKQFVRAADTGKSKEALVNQLPVVLSSVYRMGIVTARDNYYNVHPLVYQLDSFQETQTLIDQVLVIMGEFRRQGLVSRYLYESLYFSRAFNRVAWANKLLIGTAWKNYVICPPSDVVGMVALAMADLDQLLVLQELPPNLNALSVLYKEPINKDVTRDVKERDVSQILTDRYADRFKQWSKDSLEMRTYRLMNFEDDQINLSRLTTKRTLNQVYGVLEFYNSQDTQQAIALGKSNYTLERILSKDNQPFFKSLEQLVSFLGIY